MQRILYVHENPEISGISNSIYSLISHLDPEQWASVVVCPSGSFSKRLEGEGRKHIPFQFRLRRLKVGIPNTQTRFINPIALAQKLLEGRELAQIARREHINLIHTNSLNTHIVGLVASRLTGVPILWHIHYIMPRLLYKLALPERIVFVSEAVRHEAFPVNPPATTRIIYNGFNSTVHKPASGVSGKIRREFGIAPDQPLAALIGVFDPIKGQREVVTAWKQVLNKYPQAVLLLVGDGVYEAGLTYKRQVETLTQQLDIANSIVFTGYRSDIPDILRAVDVYIAFTHNDANSISVLEAMAAGKAIVAADSGGVPELITHEKSGLLAEDGNIDSLAHMIIRLIGNAELRASLGRVAYDRAWSQFTLEKYVDQMITAYNEILVETS